MTKRKETAVSRRDFLTAGALGVGSLTLADLLQAESEFGIGSSRKAIINVHLDGGPPQMDMIDMKPDSPSEVRGEFSPISTVLPGFQVCELMPKLATTATGCPRATSRAAARPRRGPSAVPRSP